MPDSALYIIPVPFNNPTRMVFKALRGQVNWDNSWSVGEGPEFSFLEVKASFYYTTLPLTCMTTYEVGSGEGKTAKLCKLSEKIGNESRNLISKWVRLMKFDVKELKRKKS